MAHLFSPQRWHAAARWSKRATPLAPGSNSIDGAASLGVIVARGGARRYKPLCFRFGATFPRTK
jgi:hypothetical protein